MRIVWVSPHCWPDYTLREDGLGVKSQGGQTVVMYHCTLALAEAIPDLEIDIYARLEDGEPEQVDLHPRVRVIRLPLGPTDSYLPKERFWGEPIDAFIDAMEGYAKEHGLKYDLVHGHYADGWHVAHEICRRWRIPYLCTTHSLGIRKRDNAMRQGEGSEAELDLKYNFTPRIASERVALAAADRICPLTVEEGEYMVREYGVDAGKVRIINNGVIVGDLYPPDASQTAALRNELGLDPDDVPILLIARVDPRKGQRELIEAAPRVIREVKNKSGKKVKLLFVAWTDSDLAVQLERRVDELGIREHVIFHPPVLNKEIGRFFWVSGVYSLSSSYDIFPIVMLEAMASGLPIVATKNGGPSEVVVPGETGYLVEPTDKEELAEALISVLADEAQGRRLGENAHRTVMERYTWGKIAERTAEVYRELLSESRERESTETGS